MHTYLWGATDGQFVPRFVPAPLCNLRQTLSLCIQGSRVMVFAHAAVVIVFGSNDTIQHKGPHTVLVSSWPRGASSVIQVDPARGQAPSYKLSVWLADCTAYSTGGGFPLEALAVPLPHEQLRATPGTKPGNCGEFICSWRFHCRLRQKWAQRGYGQAGHRRR